MSEVRRYRKKPVEVDAIQYTGDNFRRINTWMTENGWPAGRNPDQSVIIHTLEGEMRANIGDWIIRGVQGEFYPIKEAIFRETYEPVEGES